LATFAALRLTLFEHRTSKGRGGRTLNIERPTSNGEGKRRFYRKAAKVAEERKAGFFEIIVFFASLGGLCGFAVNPL
jgi:hypothetical protein